MVAKFVVKVISTHCTVIFGNIVPDIMTYIQTNCCDV